MLYISWFFNETKTVSYKTKGLYWLKQFTYFLVLDCLVAGKANNLELHKTTFRNSVKTILEFLLLKSVIKFINASNIKIVYCKLHDYLIDQALFNSQITQKKIQL